MALTLYSSLDNSILDSDELMPKSGKDKTYDEVMERISGLESSLEEDLKELEEQVGLVLASLRKRYTSNIVDRMFAGASYHTGIVPSAQRCAYRVPQITIFPDINMDVRRTYISSKLRLVNRNYRGIGRRVEGRK